MDSANGKLRALLTFLSGDHADQTIKLRRDATIFGRQKGDIIIHDKEVSSTHCQIQEINAVHHVFDMNSTNGTFVNNERVVKAKLNEGDIVTLGSTSFKFSLMAENAIRDIPTAFRTLGDATGSSASSLIETLIESEMRSTQFSGMRLIVKYKDGKQDIIDLRQRVIFIGRASTFGAFDQDPEISRKHLMIKLNNEGEVFIEDQKSTNGTFLNAKRIKGMHPVGKSDLVRVGDTELQIEALSA